MITIKCKNGSFEISEEEGSILKKYKAAEEDNTFKTMFSQLTYENMNFFMNFLNNPTDELLNKIDVDNLDEMINAIKTIIDISCKYALNEGKIDRILYRYEDERNIEGYKKGQLSSIKSTSIKPGGIKFDFGRSNTKALSIKSLSFCPYIKIDDILKNKALYSAFNFSNEQEYILPPYINCILTDMYEEDRMHTDNYRIVFIDDNYSDADPDKMVDSYKDYNNYRNSYINLLSRDKNQGIISEELKIATQAINNYLREYARCKYSKYSILYNKKYKINEIPIEINEYSGIEDAIKKYCSNQDSKKSRLEELNLHALKYLIEQGFLSEKEIFRIYETKDIKELEKILKERNENSQYRFLSEQEYNEFLNLFNIAAGYVKEKPTSDDRTEAYEVLTAFADKDEYKRTNRNIKK